MTAKRPSLAESLRQAVEAEGAPVSMSATLPIPGHRAAAVKPEQAVRPPGFYAATRAGKKKVTAALAPAVHKQLKSLAVARETTTEALLSEAIDDLFRKYGAATPS